MFQNNQHINVSLNQESEISAIDILIFLNQYWRIITAFSATGLAFAIIYLSTVPNLYQAIAQIQMAQIAVASLNNTNLAPSSSSIEDPSLLVSRLSIPTTFTPTEIIACGLDGKEKAAIRLVESIKLTQPKGTSNLVELKTTASNPVNAQQCINAIFDLIKISQAKIAEPYIKYAKIKLVNSQERLEIAKNFLVNSEKSGLTMSAAYLFTRDEIRYLRDEITSLQSIIAVDVNSQARLVAPIYVSEISISLKKQIIVLVVGLLGGFLLGLFIVLLSQTIPKLRMQLAKSRGNT